MEVQKKSFLIVDPEKSIRRILIEALSFIYFAEKPVILEVEDGIAASQMISRQKFDLIILNPATRKVELQRLLEQMSSSERLRPRSVIIFSDEDFPAQWRQLFSPMDYLERSSSPELIQATIQEIIYRSDPELQKIQSDLVNVAAEVALKALAVTGKINGTVASVGTKMPSERSGDISGVVVIDGQNLSGSLSFSFDEAPFLEMLKTMYGEPVQEVTPEWASLAGEFCNQVFGVVRAKLNKAGYKIKRLIPETIHEKNHAIPHPKGCPIYLIRIKIPSGNCTVEFCFRVKYR